MTIEYMSKRFNFWFAFAWGVSVGIFISANIFGLEHHTKPYTIAYETITVQDKIDCLQDPNCNDIILWSDLPQRKDGQ